MSDEDLEVLITLDDPWYGPDENLFHKHQEDYNEMLLTIYLKSAMLFQKLRTVVKNV